MQQVYNIILGHFFAINETKMNLEVNLIVLVIQYYVYIIFMKQILKVKKINFFQCTLKNYRIQNVISKYTKKLSRNYKTIQKNYFNTQ